MDQSTMKPHVVFPPGDLIKEELEARGWTQVQFAAILGRPFQVVNGILNGKREITPETALQLSAALGSSAEVWARMEAEYRLHLAAQKFVDGDAIAARAQQAS